MNSNYKFHIINQAKTNYNLSYNAYYPYGMLVPTRNYSNPVYRYGFQGQEKDNEIKGIGNSINYKFRMHDPRIGRFFAVDPEAKKYSFQSPYAFATNNPVRLVDVDGLGVETDFINKSNGKHIYINDGVDQIVLTDDKDWKFIAYMNVAETWNIEESYHYDNIISNGKLDWDSDLGKLARLAFAEFEGQGIKAKMIAAESVLNRIDYNGKYKKYSSDLNVSTVAEAINAPNAYAESPHKQQYTDPYGYLNGGGGFGTEYRDKIARGKLAEAVYAAFKVKNDKSSRTGAMFYVSPPNTEKTLKSYNAYKEGNMELLKLDINGISGAGKLTK